jgi:hypothetical protein
MSQQQDGRASGGVGGGDHGLSSSSESQMTTVQFDVNTDLSPERFPAWMALSVFSIICITAQTAKSNENESNNSQEKWTLAVLSLSLILSFLSVLAYLFGRGLYVNQTPEFAMVRNEIFICQRKHTHKLYQLLIITINMEIP